MILLVVLQRFHFILQKIVLLALEKVRRKERKMAESTIPRMLTIKNLVKACEGTDITEHFVRRLIAQGKIPCVKAGVKFLINYDRFVEYLNAPQEEAPEVPLGTIRKIEGGMGR